MSYNTKCLNANNSSTAAANSASTAFDVSEASLYGGAGGVDEKPPAPPVRLASARAEANNCNSNANSNHHGPFHSHHHNNIINNNNNTSHLPLDMRPLPKAPEEDKKALKKSKLRSSMKRSGGDGSSNGGKGASGGHQSKDGGSGASGASAFYGGKASHGHHHEKPVISPPTNFEHTLHVGFDPTTGEFTGMPKNWYLMLKNSNISKTEQKKNPQAVIEVLKWYESKDKDKGFKYMTMGECETSNLFSLSFLCFPNCRNFYFPPCQFSNFSPPPLFRHF